MYLKPGAGFTKLQLFTIDKVSGESSFLKEYTKSTRPKEDDIKGFSYCATEDIKDSLNKLLTYTLMGIMLSAVFFAGMKNNNNSKKAVNQIQKELALKNLKPLQSDTIQLSLK